MENSTNEFLALLEEETIMINGGGTKKAKAEAFETLGMIGGLGGLGSLASLVGLIYRLRN